MYGVLRTFIYPFSTPPTTPVKNDILTETQTQRENKIDHAGQALGNNKRSAAGKSLGMKRKEKENGDAGKYSKM